ncbi:MAG: membrane integrity-associated transporter subunit PqiC [Sedimentisphaerales bacterium]|nr:membrane integrity-associated transporter subunit PqiC [Sedimentisphaerales bacterium]
MTCKWTRVALCLVPAACSLVLSGCARPVSANTRFYMLQTLRQAPPATREGKAVLAIPRFTIDAAYAGRGLVYRLDEHRYESDAYNEFLIAPAVMATEKTRDWLAGSGLFAQVLSSGSGADPTHRIEANITALYGDFRDKAAPKAVIEMRFFLLRTETGIDPEIVFAKSYRAACDTRTADPEGLVAGFDQCLRTILTELEKDLADVV